MLSKTSAIWFVMVIAAVVNAGIREKLLVPAIGPYIALPVSGIVLSMLIFLAVFLTIPLAGSLTGRMYFCVGLYWVVLTLSFDLLFGYFAAGESWHEIMQVFNVRKGDLFILVLLATLISPWLSARLRGLV